MYAHQAHGCTQHSFPHTHRGEDIRIFREPSCVQLPYSRKCWRIQLFRLFGGGQKWPTNEIQVLNIP